MTRDKISIFTFLMVFFFSIPSFSQPDKNSVLDRGVLRCAYISYPPYFEIDVNTGEKHGIMVDVMDKIARKLDINVEWTEETGWGTMIEGIKAGRYDAVCSAVWQNAARTKYADFSIPLSYSRVDAYARSDDGRFSNDLSAINQPSVRMSVMDGEMSENLSNDLFPQAKQVSLPQTAPFSDLLLNVTMGKADLVFAEPQVAKDFLVAHPDSLKNITAKRPLAVFPVTILLSKDDERLKPVIDAALQELILTRKMETIFSKYQKDGSGFLMTARPYE